MGKKALVCVLLLALLVSPVLAAAGGAEDPLVSASWLYQVLAPRLEALFRTESAARLDGAVRNWEARLDRLSFPEPGEPGCFWAADLQPLRLELGGTLELEACTTFLPASGTLVLHRKGGELLDLTLGEVVPDGQLLLPGHRYFTAEGASAQLSVHSEAAAGAVQGNYRFTQQGELPAARRFLDLDGHWCVTYAEKLVERGLMNGTSDTTFSPDDTVTRGMFVTVLGRLAGAAGSTGSGSYPDVAADAWYAPYVYWASGQGIVTGYDDGRFGPGDPITREQMALILIRYCDQAELRLPTRVTEGSFTDADRISAWAAEAMSRAREYGLMTGRADGSCAPQSTAGRGEMCAMICRLLEAGEEGERTA